MGHTFGDVQTRVLADEDATPERIQVGLRWLVCGCLESDTVIVLFSGHAAKAHKGLYYLPYAGDMRNLDPTSLNWTDVGEKLAAIKAKQIFFLTDCCQAGAFGQGHSTQAAIAQSVAGATNLAVFASSDADHQSIEVG